MNMKNTSKLLISISISLLIGFLGSFFTTSSVGLWYSFLNKPFFSPPDWLFAPVWTILYILIGISFYLVWKKDFGKKKKEIILIYSLQLFFNFLWSVLFFGLRNPLFGFLEILILFFFIILNMVYFYRVSKTAGYLFIPYLLWVFFASILNFSILIIN